MQVKSLSRCRPLNSHWEISSRVMVVDRRVKIEGWIRQMGRNSEGFSVLVGPKLSREIFWGGGNCQEVFKSVNSDLWKLNSKGSVLWSFETAFLEQRR